MFCVSGQAGTVKLNWASRAIGQHLITTLCEDCDWLVLDLFNSFDFLTKHFNISINFDQFRHSKFGAAARAGGLEF